MFHLNIFTMNFSQRISGLLTAGLLALGATGVEAQQLTLLWGAGSTNTRIDSLGRFAYPNATDTAFANDPVAVTNDWVTVAQGQNLNISAQGVLVGTPDPSTTALWERTLAPRSRGAFAANVAALNSPSANDGAAIFDSDFLDNNGSQTGFGTGRSPSGHHSELWSPIMDLTGYTDSTIVVRFHTHYRNFRVLDFLVGFSSDGGQTWTDTEMRTITGVFAVNQSFQGRVDALFSLQGVTDPSNCRLRFVFRGDYYYWMVDDVRVFGTGAVKDVALGLPEYLPLGTPGNAIRGATTVKVSNNYFTPISQVDAEQFFYGARLTNYSATAITSADNLNLNLKVEYDDAGTWTQVFSTSTPLPDLPVGADTLLDQDITTWVPDRTGDYRVTYTSSMIGDYNPVNDSAVQFFTITEDYFSKVPNNLAGQPSANGQALVPATAVGDTIERYDFGSVFYTPKGLTGGQGNAGFRLDSVTYRVNADANITVNRVPVTIRVYKFNAFSSGAFIAQNGSNLTQLAVGVDTVDTSPANRGAFLTRTVGLTDIITLDDGLKLDDTTAYFVAIEQENTAGIFIGLAGNQTRFNGIGYAALRNTENYSYNIFRTSSPATPPIAAPVVLRIGTRGGASNWSIAAFGGSIIPSLGFKIVSLFDPTNVAQTQVAGDIKLFPNPTRQTLNVQVNFEQMQSNVEYRIVDVMGRVIQSTVRSDIQNEIYQMDLNNLPSGVYFLNIANERGNISTQSFIKQ